MPSVRHRRPIALLSLIALVVLATIPGCVIGGDSDGYDARATHSISLAQPTAAKGKLIANSRNGSITVKKAPDGQLKIDALVRSRSEGRAKDASVQVEESATATTITIAWPDNRWQNGDGADLDIWLPDASGLELTTTNGDISTAGFSGKLNATTSNASIEVRSHAGDVVARTSNADIEASGVTGDIDATTSNSSVTLVDVSGSVVAATSNGDIDVSLLSTSGGPVRAATSNAAITLRVGPGFTGDLSAATSNGRVECTEPRARGSRAGKTAATWSFGPGPQSSLSSTNGDITVKSR